MAFIDLPRAGSGSFGRGLAAMVNIARAWNDARRTRQLLETLSDHELDDIGLSRGDIARAARG